MQALPQSSGLGKKNADLCPTRYE